MSYDVQILKNNFPLVKRQMHLAIRKTVYDAGDRILIEAKRRIVSLDIIDTGNLLNSGYVRTKEFDNYVANINFPGMRLPAPTHDLEVQVNFSASYAIFHEEGTIHMGARPFLKPAVEAVRPHLVRMLQRNLKQAGF